MQYDQDPLPGREGTRARAAWRAQPSLFTRGLWRVCELPAMLAGRESCEPILDQRLEKLESMIRDHDVASFCFKRSTGTT